MEWAERWILCSPGVVEETVRAASQKKMTFKAPILQNTLGLHFVQNGYSVQVKLQRNKLQRCERCLLTWENTHAQTKHDIKASGHFDLSIKTLSGIVWLRWWNYSYLVSFATGAMIMVCLFVCLHNISKIIGVNSAIIWLWVFCNAA